MRSWITIQRIVAFYVTMILNGFLRNRKDYIAFENVTRPLKSHLQMVWLKLPKPVVCKVYNAKTAEKQRYQIPLDKNFVNGTARAIALISSWQGFAKRGESHEEQFKSERLEKRPC